MGNEQKQAARRAIINKHCRMQTGARAGTPKFCHPTRDQVIRAAGKGHPAQRRPPIIFDSIEAAQECADELEKLDGIKLTVYPCPRSTSGHAHLSGHSNEGTDMPTAVTEPRTTKGVLFDIMISRATERGARELRTTLNASHEMAAISDWPARGGFGVPRQHAFDAALVELIAAGVAEQVGNKFAPVRADLHLRLREFAEAAGPAGFTQDQLAEQVQWPDPEHLNTALQLARECGVIVRPDPAGRHYHREHAPAA
jgi:hypothetical protein